jgi:hypothetical protein
MTYEILIIIPYPIVNGRQHSAHIQSMLQSRRCNLRPTLYLESDKINLDTSIHDRDELDSAVQLPKFRSVGSWTACYI